MNRNKLDRWGWWIFVAAGVGGFVFTLLAAGRAASNRPLWIALSASFYLVAICALRLIPKWAPNASQGGPPQGGNLILVDFERDIDDRAAA